jgi:hypothetical protein
MVHTKLVSVFAGLVALMSLPAHAQMQNCAPRDVVIERLASKYGEVFSGGGMQSGTAVFEVWTSAEDGTWTILMTHANGRSCVMAAGTNWREALDSQKQVVGAPT